MEEIKRKIRLFFAIYGSLLLKFIGIIAVILLSIRAINNYMYAGKETPSYKEIDISKEIAKREKIEEDKKFILEFLDYCNSDQIKLAYEMLSEECINDKYKTLEEFKKEYINKIFTQKKDYEVKEEDGKYKITILENMLESGKTDNRSSIINYFIIKETVLGKEIYIER